MFPDRCFKGRGGLRLWRSLLTFSETSDAEHLGLQVWVYGSTGLGIRVYGSTCLGSTGLRVSTFLGLRVYRFTDLRVHMFRKDRGAYVCGGQRGPLADAHLEWEGTVCRKSLGQNTQTLQVPRQEYDKCDKIRVRIRQMYNKIRDTRYEIRFFPVCPEPSKFPTCAKVC
jgi:hypothetical protein